MPPFLKTAKGLVSVLSFLGLALSAGCSRSEEDPNLMVMHYHLKDDVKTWDPANEYDSVSGEVVPSVYETLYQYAYLNETYKIVPLLAADLPKVSRDRLTYTIPLRHDIKCQEDHGCQDC